MSKTWEEAKDMIRAELDRLWAENEKFRDEAAQARADLEIAKEELAEAARAGGILGLCSRCGHREAV